MGSALKTVGGTLLLLLVFAISHDSAAQFRPAPIPHPRPFPLPLPPPPNPFPRLPPFTPDTRTFSPLGPSTGGPGSGGESPRRPGTIVGVPFDEDEYLEDVKKSLQIIEHLEDGIVVIFSADERLRAQAMRDLLRDLAVQQIDRVAVKAREVLVAQRADNEAQVHGIEDSLLGIFRWQTKGELRRNIEAIRRTESEVQSLRQQARQQARSNISSWSPSPGWQRTGRITTNLGRAWGQLNRISISGWPGS